MTDFRLWQPDVAADGDRSFWLQDVDAKAATPPFSGDATCDVAIIGGGYCGLWTALRLRGLAPGLKIVVLEADICGGGASGRNGGQVHSWFAEIDLLTRLCGADEALSLCRATADAIEELAALQSSGAIDMDLRLDGWMWTASSSAQEGAWSDAVAQCREKAEYRFVGLSAAEIMARTGSQASYTGVIEPRAGTVHPAKLALGLRALALSRGVEIHEKTPVSEIASGSPCTLRMRAGTMRAGKVVIATNAWASAIPEIRRCMYVIDSLVIATEPMADRLDGLGWTGGVAICDAQSHVLYYQRTPAGRVIFGRGCGNVAYGNRPTPAFNRCPAGVADNIREMHRVYPDLMGARLDHDWSGPIDCMPEHLPAFGHLTGHPNIFFGAGFNGTGIAQTPVAGRILASLVLGLDDRWSQSGLVGLRRRTTLPPEPVRNLCARIVRRAIRIRNDLEIRNQAPGPLIRWLAAQAPGR
jgi:glycine/D-amino acid oxidase-like deaminating enzyme